MGIFIIFCGKNRYLCMRKTKDMEILYLTGDEEQSRSQISEALGTYGVKCTHMRASGNILGIFKIATQLKHHVPDAVVANSADLLYNVISAKKMAHCPTLPVVALIDANADRPRSIASVLREGVDKWIFPSQKHADAYPADLRKKAVCPIATLGIEAERTLSGNSAHTYIWVGPIDNDNNTALLRYAIKTVADQPGARMVICGQGKARYIMPAVQEAKRMPKPDAYTWTGKTLTPSEVTRLLDRIDAPRVWFSSFDPTPMELALDWLTNPDATAPEKLIKALAYEIKTV